MRVQWLIVLVLLVAVAPEAVVGACQAAVEAAVQTIGAACRGGRRVSGGCAGRGCAVKLKVDTAGMTFLLVKDARPVRDYETKQAKANSDGVPLFSVQLVAMGDGEAEILSVKVAGQPEGLTAGGPVTVDGLTAQAWSVDGKSGVAFHADAIRDGARTTAGIARGNGSGQASA